MSRETRAPLFDRLVDLEPHRHREIRPQRTLDRRELKESVRRELARLIGTRCPVSAAEMEDRPRTVIDYGIPDFSSFSAARHDDRKRLAAAVREAIEAYEPRLREVEVIIEPASGGFELSGRIEAVLVGDEVAEAVSFPTVFMDRMGAVEVQPASPLGAEDET